MENYLPQLLSIDYINLLSAVAIIMAATIAIKELIEKFCKATGIEFAWIRSNRERRECERKIRDDLDAITERQKDLEERYINAVKSRDKFNTEIIDNMQLLKEKIISLSETMERREAEKRFEKLRDDILTFANELSSKTHISEEYISNVYHKINEYEKLHEQYEFQNNQAPASIAAITVKYQEMLLNGQITKDDE